MRRNKTLPLMNADERGSQESQNNVIRRDAALWNFARDCGREPDLQFRRSSSCLRAWVVKTCFSPCSWPLSGLRFVPQTGDSLFGGGA